MSDVLVSFVKGDRPWADWMGWVLEENGHTTTLQAIDLEANDRTVGLLEKAMQTSSLNTILLSNDWLQSDVIHSEFELLFERIVSSKQRLVPVRVEPCQPVGFLSTLRYLDLVDQSEEEAERSLLTLFSDSPALRQHSGGDDSEPYMDGLRLRRRSHTVKGFVEPLVDGLGIEMTLVPGGTFLMGSPLDESDRTEAEGPQHKVTVQPFFMGTYPITQEQWRAIASMSQVNRVLELEPSAFKGDNHPVETISWDDAVEACDRLSAHTGRTYRLPSEAEWEYACRAETTTPFHFGPTITTDYANYCGDGSTGGSPSYGPGPAGIYRKETTAVGSFGVANAFGLCDMHGNVWEWCEDHWHDSYKDAPPDSSVWLENPPQSNMRVIRGGSWLDLPGLCRSASRSRLESGFRYFYLGFRVVVSAPRTL